MRLTIVIVTALLAGVAPAAAQTAEETHAKHMRLMHETQMHGPIAMLLGHREEFGITAGQLSRLKAIQERIEEKINPKIKALHALMPQHSAGTHPKQEDMSPEARKLMQEIHSFFTAALEEAHTVLTPEQLKKIKALHDQHHK